MSDETPSEKKLYVDEDWKSQVEAEREAARQAEEAKKPAESGPATGARGPLPPANFTFLVSTLYLQGAMALGRAPAETIVWATGQPHPCVDASAGVAWSPAPIAGSVNTSEIVSPRSLCSSEAET